MQNSLNNIQHHGTYDSANNLLYILDHVIHHLSHHMMDNMVWNDTSHGIMNQVIKKKSYIFKLFQVSLFVTSVG